jgi:hypothetical protein
LPSIYRFVLWVYICKVIVVEEFYANKFADLIGAINCSINEAVVGRPASQA